MIVWVDDPSRNFVPIILISSSGYISLCLLQSFCHSYFKRRNLQNNPSKTIITFTEYSKGNFLNICLLNELSYYGHYCRSMYHWLQIEQVVCGVGPYCKMVVVTTDGNAWVVVSAFIVIIILFATKLNPCIHLLY